MLQWLKYNMYRCLFVPRIILMALFCNIIKRTGPRTNPCGTPNLNLVFAVVKAHFVQIEKDTMYHKASMAPNEIYL